MQIPLSNIRVYKVLLCYLSVLWELRYISVCNFNYFTNYVDFKVYYELVNRYILFRRVGSVLGHR